MFISGRKFPVDFVTVSHLFQSLIRYTTALDSNVSCLIESSIFYYFLLYRCVTVWIFV